MQHGLGIVAVGFGDFELRFRRGFVRLGLHQAGSSGLESQLGLVDVLLVENTALADSREALELRLRALELGFGRENGRLGLCDLCGRLTNGGLLLQHFDLHLRDVQHGQNLALLHVVTDVRVPFLHVAGDVARKSTFPGTARC